MVLSAKDLHEIFLNSLGKSVVEHGDVDEKPLEIDLKSPLPGRIRLYLYNVTHPPGGRTLNEHKAQIIIPGQTRQQWSSFDDSDQRIVVLAGYEPENEVFVLWDSGLYPKIAFSRNVQVKPETVYEAVAGKIGRQKRIIKGQGVECVITCPSNRLPEALLIRMKETCIRLMEM